MKLNSKMTQEDICEALTGSFSSTWGADKSDQESLEAVARSIWVVLQVPMAPLSEEPDFLGSDVSEGDV